MGATRSYSDWRSGGLGPFLLLDSRNDGGHFYTERLPKRLSRRLRQHEHFCMGVHFARRSMRAIVEQLARRVEAWEVAGDPEWIRASFVVGLKHLPVRYRIRAS